MATKPKPTEPQTTPAPPVPTEGGSYDLVDGELRKRAPDAPQPAEAPANKE